MDEELLRIARARTASQRLTRPAAWTPARLVSWFGAVQSQDYPLGRWSIAQRLATKSSAIDEAIAAGSILRTHVLRPTWHFVAREDLRWMQELTSARVLALMKGWNPRHGIDAATIARSTKIIAVAIERRGHLTRRDVAEVLSRARIAATPLQVGLLLMHAELRAVICSGVPAGRHQTHALVDERAPRASSMPRDEALATLARRYFQSHGPATTRDFRWWSGLSAADAARAIDALGRGVTRQRDGDRVFLSIGRPSRAARTQTAHVIQPFDELVVAYSESRDVVDVSGRARAAMRGDGAALLTRGIVHDGQIVARWIIVRVAGRSTVVMHPLRRLSRRERDAVADATARFDAFCAER